MQNNGLVNLNNEIIIGDFSLSKGKFTYTLFSNEDEYLRRFHNDEKHFDFYNTKYSFRSNLIKIFFKIFFIRVYFQMNWEEFSIFTNDLFFKFLTQNSIQQSPPTAQLYRPKNIMIYYFLIAHFLEIMGHRICLILLIPT
jgi:hypothetical protein